MWSSLIYLCVVSTSMLGRSDAGKFSTKGIEVPPLVEIILEKLGTNEKAQRDWDKIMEEWTEPDKIEALKMVYDVMEFQDYMDYLKVDGLQSLTVLDVWHLGMFVYQNPTALKDKVYLGDEEGSVCKTFELPFHLLHEDLKPWKIEICTESPDKIMNDIENLENWMMQRRIEILDWITRPTYNDSSSSLIDEILWVAAHYLKIDDTLLWMDIMLSEGKDAKVLHRIHALVMRKMFDIVLGESQKCKNEDKLSCALGSFSWDEAWNAMLQQWLTKTGISNGESFMEFIEKMEPNLSEKMKELVQHFYQNFEENKFNQGQGDDKNKGRLLMSKETVGALYGVLQSIQTALPSFVKTRHADIISRQAIEQFIQSFIFPVMKRFGSRDMWMVFNDPFQNPNVTQDFLMYLLENINLKKVFEFIEKITETPPPTLEEQSEKMPAAVRIMRIYDQIMKILNGDM